LDKIVPVTEVEEVAEPAVGTLCVIVKVNVSPATNVPVPPEVVMFPMLMFEGASTE
jgi:hypothetical protein